MEKNVLRVLTSDAFCWILVFYGILNTIQTDAWTNLSQQIMQFSDFDDVIKAY